MLSSEGKELRKFNHTLYDLFVDVFRLLVIIERRVARKKFVNKDPDSPIINSLTIA